jgi:hypothetical protein
LLNAVLKEDLERMALEFFVLVVHCIREVCYARQVILVFVTFEKMPHRFNGIDTAGTFGEIFVVYSGRSSSLRSNGELLVYSFDGPVLFTCT